MKILTLALSLALGLSATAAEKKAVFPAKNMEFLNRYCMDCHDADTEKGDVNLEGLPFHITTIEQAERWQKVLASLNSGEMPPEKKKQPTNDEKANFLDDLAATMVEARKVLSDSGGKITMRRLNRREYQNTVKEALGVEVDVKDLPQDGGGGSFDTAGSSQFISSDQFEKYLEIGSKALDEFFDRQKTKGITKSMAYRVEPEKTMNPQLRKSVLVLEDRQRRIDQWKAAVDKVAELPENKAMLAEFKKNNKKNFPEKDLFYRNAEKLKNTPDPKEYGFRDAGRTLFAQTTKDRSYNYTKHYLSLPGNDRGTYLKTTWGVGRLDITPLAGSMPPGIYKIRISAGIAEGAPDFRHFIELGHPQRQNQLQNGLEGFPISTHHVTGTVAQPSLIETEVLVTADTQREFSVQERQPAKATALRSVFAKDKKKNGYGTPASIWIDWIEVEGPIKTNETVSILEKVLDKNKIKVAGNPRDYAWEARDVRATLKDFARATMRETDASEEFLDQLMDLYKGERTNGSVGISDWSPFEEAVKLPLSIILASPGFLYLNEPGTDESRRALSQRELAVRLAYFLWSSPPDEQLLDLAKEDKLKETDVLRKQVDRMIADKRADKFIAGFVHQWLDMKRLDFFQFDTNLHREFDESTRAAARQEVYQTFAHLLRGNDSGYIGNLLKSDFVVINGLLGTYYGLEGVEGDEFRKVKLPENSPRGGLLGMAAINAMGSDGVESSPVERGAWVLRHLLNSPPPPAPANVPQISRLAGKKLTTRERLTAHQEKAQCASCHRKIDPIGLGMENFGAAGKWRLTAKHEVTKKNKQGLIETAGEFHNGPAFANFFEMRRLIAQRKDDFARGFTEALIEYGLGRSFAFTDEDLANELMDAAKSKNYNLSEFFHAIVQSKEFQSK
jgi:hypothetical protein